MHKLIGSIKGRVVGQIGHTICNNFIKMM